MLADFISGVALIAIGGFLFILALPGRRRRRRRSETPIRELRRQVRQVLIIATMGASLLTGGFGLVVTIAALAGFQVWSI